MTRRAVGARRASSRSRSRRCIRSISSSSASTPGETLTIESRRGKISLYARADDGTPRGAVFVPFCYYEAAANMLTNPVLDPFGKIPEFKYCAVRVTKGGIAPVHSSFGGGTLLTDGSSKCRTPAGIVSPAAGGDFPRAAAGTPGGTGLRRERVATLSRKPY